MVVVETSGKAGVDLCRNASAHCEALDPSVPIKEECTSVAHPIRCFETPSIKISNAAVRRIDLHRLQRAVENRLSRRSCWFRQFDIREHSLFHNIFVMRADAEPDVEFALQ